MPTERVDFANARGQTLAALLELPDREPVATAPLAHCFTCGKDDLVAKRIAETLALAKYPNVSCKLSAAPGHSSEAYPFGDMTPVVKRVFDAFGPQRCYWGTDMTNSFAKATYRQRVTHFTETLDFLSESDKDWVMGRAILARLGWA